MPATVTTREIFPMSTEDSALEVEISLRMKAGAVRSDLEVEGDHKVLVTEWKVIESDD